MTSRDALGLPWHTTRLRDAIRDDNNNFVAQIYGALPQFRKARRDFIIIAANNHHELVECLRIIAKAELYDPATGIVDADILEAVQDQARALLAKIDKASI